MHKTNKSPTNGDIFINTKLYGIYNPKHFHSFQSTWGVFVPQVCAACNNPVYPFVQACVCLRCRLYCHRSCTRKQPPCSQFTFEHKVSAEQRRSFAHKDSRDGSSESDLQLHKIVEKACMIPAVLGYIPEPQSHFCIWQSVLRAVAMRQNHHSTKPITITTKSIELRNLEVSIKPIVHTLLKDTNHFAGQICMVCLYVFLSLDFNNAGHIIAHARECLDTVVNSVWNICHIETHHGPPTTTTEQTTTTDMIVSSEVEKHELILQAIAFEVERFMLQEKEGAMYDKINLPIRIISKDFTFNKHVSFPSKDTKRMKQKTKEHWKIIKIQLLYAITPIDKLRCLVDILHIAANNKYFRVIEKQKGKGKDKNDDEVMKTETANTEAAQTGSTDHTTTNAIEVQPDHPVETLPKEKEQEKEQEKEEIKKESTMSMMDEEEEAVFVEEDTITPMTTHTVLEDEEDDLVVDDEEVEEEEEEEEDGWKRYSSSEDEEEQEPPLIYVHEENTHCDADTLLENLTILLLADLFHNHKHKQKKHQKKSYSTTHISHTARGMTGKDMKNSQCQEGLPLDAPLPLPVTDSAPTTTSHDVTHSSSLPPQEEDNEEEETSYDIPSQPIHETPVVMVDMHEVQTDEAEQVEVEQEPQIDWLGECLYLSSPIISKDILDLNGMEGYALVTFQQVIQSLLVHTPPQPLHPAGIDYDTIEEEMPMTTTTMSMSMMSAVDLVSVNSFEQLWGSVHHEIK